MQVKCCSTWHLNLLSISHIFDFTISSDLKYVESEHGAVRAVFLRSSYRLKLYPGEKFYWTTEAKRGLLPQRQIKLHHLKQQPRDQLGVFLSHSPGINVSSLRKSFYVWYNTLLKYSIYWCSAKCIQILLWWRTVRIRLRILARYTFDRIIAVHWIQPRAWKLKSLLVWYVFCS